jgi:chorismate mutase/prephenate dehydrogenase
MENGIKGSGKVRKDRRELPESAEKELKAIRNSIDAIDVSIVEFLAKRQNEVSKVLSLKKEYNQPAYHPAREEYLISDRRRHGKEAGLDPDSVEELFRTILRQSRAEQNFSIAGKGTRPGSRVLIVGGTGGMGKYFQKWFKISGYHTRVMGRNDWENIEELCDNIDLAVISVPIHITVPVIHQIAPHLHRDCILTDLTSIKGPAMAAMMEAHGGPVVGIHPLFGPTTSTMDKQIVVTTPGRGSEECQWVIDQFAAWGAVVVESTADEHDEIMSIVQSLRHFATFAFGQYLHKRRIDLSRTLDFSSPIYRLELGMVGRLFAQDPDLYAEIIFASEDRIELLKDYMASLTGNLDMIEKGDKEAFKRQFRTIAEWFGPFGDQALRESSYLIDKLIERF